jgi:carbon dioxide concentrating mechanism protein CcmN
MIGCGKIGGNACVGSATTILNSSVAAMAVIPAGSCLGDTSRQVTILDVSEQSETVAQEAPKETSESVTSEGEFVAEEFATAEGEAPSQSSKSPVVGQVHINNLLVTLFPERQAFKHSQQKRPSES